MVSSLILFIFTPFCMVNDNLIPQHIDYTHFTFTDITADDDSRHIYTFAKKIGSLVILNVGGYIMRDITGSNIFGTLPEGFLPVDIIQTAAVGWGPLFAPMSLKLVVNTQGTITLYLYSGTLHRDSYFNGVVSYTVG